MTSRWPDEPPAAVNCHLECAVGPGHTTVLDREAGGVERRRAGQQLVDGPPGALDVGEGQGRDERKRGSKLGAHRFLLMRAACPLVSGPPIMAA